MPTNRSISSAMLKPSLALLTSEPPQRASIPVLALEAQPPTGLPSRPTCRGAGPLQVLKTRGFAGDSRQASPVRPVYNADQPITALKGTGIGSLPKLHGHVVAQLHASITSPRIRHAVSVAMMHLSCQLPRRPTYDPGLAGPDGDPLAFMPPAQQGCPWSLQTILEPSECPSRGTVAAESLRWVCEQRVPGVRVAMRQNRIFWIEGISPGFGEPPRNLDDPFRAGPPEPGPGR